MSNPFATVFLADDDDATRKRVSETLRGDGYDVIEARDGAELLELLADAAGAPWRKPDVIIANALMPCYSGIGVLGALRHSRWDVPVILITSQHHAHAVTQNALRLGAAAVFRRPFDITDLRTAILAVRCGRGNMAGLPAAAAAACF
jgi:two-component system KDP operon response regulator KdpE